MADPTAPQVTRSYLTQLERSLAGLPAEVRDDILTGVHEELDGLDAVDAAARIEILGDPEFIAAEARAEVPASTAAPSPSPSSATDAPLVSRAVDSANSTREPSWFPVLAALTFAIGGLVIPLYGWFIGVALVWISRRWTTREKVVGTLLGPAAVVIGAGIAYWEQSTGPLGSGEGSVISNVYNAVVAQLRLLLLVNGVVGVWLAWRVSRGWWPLAAPVGKDDNDG